MDLYAPDAELEASEKALLRANAGAERLNSLVQIAWYVRQRDSDRSRKLAEEADTLLPIVELEEPEFRVTAARICLVRSEVAALFGEIEAAEEELRKSKQLLSGLHDPLERGDCAITEAMIALERGQTEREVAAYKSAISAYQEAGDPVRKAVAEGWLISRIALNDPEEASRRAEELEQSVGVDFSPALTCLLGVVRFRLAYSSDPGRAVVLSLTITDAARRAGMLRQELVYSFNAGWALIDLGDFEGAAPWIEEALQRARDAGWPMQIGLGLISLGTLLRKLGEPARARALLEEALTVMPAEGFVNQAATYWELGDVLLDLGLYREATKALEQAVQRYRTAMMTDNLSAVLISYGRAVSFEGDGERALEILKESRGVIDRFGYSTRRVDLLRALADIYQRHPKLEAGLDAVPNAVIDCLENALRAGMALVGWKPDVGLLTALRDAWAETTDLARALDYANRALERERQRAGETVAGRVALVQQRHELERVRSEAEYHRQLADTASVTSHTLDQLGRIGQEITAGLSSDHVFDMLYRNLGNLLDAPTLSVFLLDEDDEVLTMRFGMDEGVLMPVRQVSLYSPTSKAARCIRERAEVLMEGRAEEGIPSETHIPGTQIMRTALFGPLIAGERVLGALSIQSPRERAYGERERLIFRTLCAYGAIALDNAAAYRQLQAAQERIVLQEKMAGLGTLTAGVAHEINNPANFAHAGVQLLGEELQEMRLFLMALAGDDADSEILAEIGRRFDSLDAHVATVREGTTRIRDLVRDLRTFSRLDQSERKSVRLGESLESTLNLVRTQYADVSKFEVDMRADPVVDCWPALLNQVFMNLIVNACQAIKAKRADTRQQDGLVRISSYIDGAMLAVDFTDNGTGMSPATLKRVFEPFFTTKNVGEGTGLGMSISFGIVEKHNGTIEVSSTEGVGSCFTLKLPLQEFGVAS
jgi:signal transduction histidine kinase